MNNNIKPCPYCKNEFEIKQRSEEGGLSSYYVFLLCWLVFSLLFKIF